MSRTPQPTRMSALAVVCTLAAGAALAVPGVAFADDRRPRTDEVQETLDHLVEVDGVPAALATVTDHRGRDRNRVAGVGNLATGGRVPVDGQVRIGSNTKTFVATTVLLLVGDGLVELDAPVETYLPGLVRGPVDGHDITVRDLLQHTSGIGSYTNGPPFITDGAVTLTALKDWYVEPHELLALGLAQPATPPGAWSYSNTNYLLAGLLVQKVTQRPLGDVVTDRIIEPLGLRDTYVPGRGERAIRGDHPLGYHAEPAGSALFEHTDIDPASSWGAGDIVSTPGDLTTFFRALLGGEILQPAELEQMKATVPMDLPGIPEGWRYGLGLQSTELSCGELAWGHGGIIPGYQTDGGVSEDGSRGVTVATTTMHAMLPAEASADVTARISELVDTVLCS
ncbi:serine hydrolase domain-containing protein [uncultured Cellulomonas sp.]|uniref:serine hydrolase domain-containing protein n=1 Tax=uncultured Cellulomonas sp. TaxID=189682 RepID=UPI0028EF8A5E|nr:serine hydrolase domain-containing protein [uncultured Cellulomonas sp.]